MQFEISDKNKTNELDIIDDFEVIMSIRKKEFERSKLELNPQK